MTTTRAALPLLLALTAAPATARAFNSVPGHADIKVTPQYKTTAGVKRVSGCTVAFCMRKAGGGAYDSATHARPSVLLPATARTLADSQDASRNAVYEPSHSRALKLFDDVPVPDSKTVVQHKIHIDYAELGGEAAGVHSGAKLTLITAWKYNPQYAPHVYGTVTQYDEANEFTLP